MKTNLLFILLCLSFGLDAQVQGYNVGDTVDNFTVVSTDGDTYELYDITSKGQYVILDFFFFSCGPCQETAPLFNEFYETYGCNEGKVFTLTVNIGDEDDETVILFEEMFGGDFKHSPAISGDGGAAPVNDRFDPLAYPTYTLIGPDNRLLNSDIWPLTGPETFAQALENEGVTLEPMACTVSSVFTPDVPTMEVFPNPAVETIQFETTFSVDDHTRVNIYDQLGKLVVVQKFNQLNDGILDISILDNGMYFFQVIDQEILGSGKFSVVK